MKILGILMLLVTSLSLLIGLILLVTKTIAVILKLNEGKFGWSENKKTPPFLLAQNDN